MIKTVTDLIKDNYKELIPEFSILANKVTTFSNYLEAQQSRKAKTVLDTIGIKNHEEIAALKEEIEFLKSRFTPLFM